MSRSIRCAIIGNRSSGKMGYALAEAALRRGAKVILVSGPTALKPPSAAETIFVETAQQMRTAVLDRWEQASMIIMAAAVADYHVKSVCDREDQAHERDWSCNSSPIPTSSPILAACATPAANARRC